MSRETSRVFVITSAVDLLVIIIYMKHYHIVSIPHRWYIPWHINHWCSCSIFLTLYSTSTMWQHFIQWPGSMFYTALIHRGEVHILISLVDYMWGLKIWCVNTISIVIQVRFIAERAACLIRGHVIVMLLCKTTESPRGESLKYMAYYHR